MLRFIFLPRFASRAIAFALLAGLCWALLSPQPSAAQLQVQTTTPKPSTWNFSPADEDVFVLYQNERGETTCRPATKAERDQINSGRSGGPARVIYPGAPRERDGANASWYAVTMIPFTIAILRYAVDVDGGLAGEPEDIALKDRVLQLLAVAWIGTIGAAVFLS